MGMAKTMHTKLIRSGFSGFIYWLNDFGSCCLEGLQPYPLQIQLELFLIFDLQRLRLLDQFCWDGHTFAEGSTGSAPQQTTGHVGRGRLAQGGATEILHEGPLVDQFSAWNNMKEKVLISQGVCVASERYSKFPSDKSSCVNISLLR